MAALRTDGPGRAPARDLHRDRGFTLVEILIVIVILGVLATVAVFAVTGVSDKGEQSACASERKTVETALSAYLAPRPIGSPATEADLVSHGFLHDQSKLFDLDASGNIVPQPGATVTCS